MSRTLLWFELLEQLQRPCPFSLLLSLSPSLLVLGEREFG
jgi:hypothetical protein